MRMKLKDIHIAHVTGTVTVIENRLFVDRVTPREGPSRSIDQMFFKPYESKKEFVFCARNTLLPIILVGLAIINPLSIMSASAIFLGIVAGSLLASAINKGLGNDDSARWNLDVAEELMSRMIQTFVNLVVLPLAALSMLTRGISTGLKAAGIYDYDAPEDLSACCI